MRYLSAVTAACAFGATLSCSEIAYRTCDRGHTVSVVGPNAVSVFSPVTLHPGEWRAFAAHYYQGDPSAGESCGTFLYDSIERPERFIWVVSDTTIATVVSSGAVTAKVAGSTELRVSVDNTSRAITLNVVP